MSSRLMSEGYCYEFQGKLRWRGTSDARWQIEVHTPDGLEKAVGTRTIDGAACVVFKCSDGRVRAQTAVSVIVVPKYPSRAKALDLGWAFTWEHDAEPYQMGDAETEHPTEVLGCILMDENGDTLASLWAIGDPSDAYAREIEDELASEALARRNDAAKADATAHTFQAL